MRRSLGQVVTERKTKETGRIAVFDKAKKRYTVVERTEYLNAGTLEKPVDWVEGIRSYELESGDHCNVLDDGSFQVVRTGTILRRT